MELSNELRFKTLVLVNHGPSSRLIAEGVGAKNEAARCRLRISSAGARLVVIFIASVCAWNWGVRGVRAMSSACPNGFGGHENPVAATP